MMNESMKISIIGLRAAGKTTLVKRLKGDNFPVDTLPTMGVNIETLKIKTNNGNEFEILAFDLGGQESHLISVWRPFILKSDGIVFVFDSADEELADQAGIWLKQSVRWAAKNSPFLFLANKQDLKEARELKEIVNKLDLETYMNDQPRPFAVYPCSALTGKGVDRPWQWLCEQLISKRNNK